MAEMRLHGLLVVEQTYTLNTDLFPPGYSPEQCAAKEQEDYSADPALFLDIAGTAGIDPVVKVFLLQEDETPAAYLSETWYKQQLSQALQRVAELEAAAAAGEPVAWADADAICNAPDVDEAIRTLLDDQTGDNAVEVVRAILRYAQPAAARVPHVRETRFEGWLSCHEPDSHANRTPRYSKRDLRDAYWAGYCEAGLSTAAQVPQHSDDMAVDAFAVVMKAKLAESRAKGRSGWETCSPEALSNALREHTEKGDPRDVANFCMFLWCTGSGIKPSAEAAARTPLTDEQICEALGIDGGDDWIFTVARNMERAIERAHGITREGGAV
jgi:hypothetical protein